MFPFDIEDEDIDIEVDEERPEADYEVDLETGKLTGRIITGLDAIKQWIRITLATDRYRYPQYSWEHGSDLQSLIGKNYNKDYVESEVKRMLPEALLENESITGVEDIVCSYDGDSLNITATVKTIYGEVNINV